MKFHNAIAVQARGVRKRFGTVEALDGLDLEVRRGEIYGLLGPNGSGKTTFIRCVAGLVRIDGGTITLLGVSPREAVTAGRVGYMTQAAALYADLSVDENLAFFARLQDVPDTATRIEETLRTVELLDRRRSIVSTLSGGLRTRLSLAAALLHRPEALLLVAPLVVMTLVGLVWGSTAETISNVVFATDRSNLPAPIATRLAETMKLVTAVHGRAGTFEDGMAALKDGRTDAVVWIQGT